MVYGWNDVVDRETDAVNPRKDSFWFGARGSAEQLEQLWKPIALTQLIFIAPLLYIGGWKIGVLFLGFILINGLYNLPKHGLRSRPPLELLCQIGYLLVAPLSMLINDTDIISLTTYAYLFLFAMQSHLMGEVMDIDPDRLAKRRTTATMLGRVKTKLLIMAIVVLEVLLLFVVYEDYIFGGMLLMGFIWLIIDLFFLFKSQTYTLGQMKLFAFGSNVLAVASMIYVWVTGVLM